MQAGHLDQLITIQQNTPTRDPNFNSEQANWVTFVANLRANCADLTGAEAVRQGLRVMDRPVKVMTRFVPGVTTAMRVLESDGRIFNIVSVAEIPRRRGLELLCQEYSV